MKDRIKISYQRIERWQKRRLEALIKISSNAFTTGLANLINRPLDY
jgi:hypothetical protein